MTRTRLNTLMAIALAMTLAAGSARAGQAQIDALMKQITSDDAEKRNQAVQAFSDMGPEAIKPLLTAVGHQNRSIGKAARMALHNIVVPTGRFGGEYERIAASQALASELGNAALPYKTRAYMCRLLSYVGRDEAVPALVTALSAQDIREMARWALSRNSSEAALTALHMALTDADPEFRVGIINAIGRHAERRSVEVLAKELKHDNDKVRIAAMAAIGKIADPFAMEHLEPLLTTGSPKQQAAARAAWLSLGETLLDSKRPYAASVIFDAALAWDTTSQDRCVAIWGLAKAGQPGALDELLAALREAKTDDVRGAVTEALTQMPSPKVTEAVVALLTGKQKKSGLFKGGKALSPANQAALVNVLAARKDKAGQPGAVAALQSDSETVRIAALKCLAVIGQADAAPALAESLQKPEGPERQAAVYALGRLPAPNGLTWLQEEVYKPGLSEDYRILLIKAISNRREPGSVAALEKLLAKDRPESIRIAAYEALGKLGDADGLPTLLEGVDQAEGKARDAAEAAMLKLEAVATPRMVEAMSKATPHQQAALLRVLGFRHHPKIKPLLIEAAKCPEELIQAAAIEGLRRMADPSTLSVLEKAAAKGPARGPAVSGMINIGVKFQKQGKKDEALTIYHKALKLATRDKEIRPALDRLAEIADPSSFDAARPFLNKGNAKANAARVVLAVGPKVSDDRKADLVPALKQAIAIAPKDKNVRKAQEKLVKLGVDIDIAKEAGFVTHWWVTGPFPSPDKAMFDKAYFPEKKVDLGAKTKVGDKEYTWKKVRIKDPSGIADLRKLVASADSVGCYAYAEVTSPKDQDVLLKIGSDDDVVCWLNGKKVHANKVSRGVQVDQDVVKARLKKGKNAILMKVLNGGSHWNMCLRITDRQNNPLKLTERKK